jgi:hopene-associated glycosyltransferase HpnB
MEQGIRYANTNKNIPDYFLLTDADIEHSINNISQLMAKAETENLALVSLMVLLRCESFWEKLLIPAFVFFFEKLYPFTWVNDAKNKMAAAAGGCILIRRDSLTQIGGLEVVRQALIDDCSLAKEVKKLLQSEDYSQSNHSTNLPGIWLGLTETTRSLRPYLSLKTIWDMVARTAFTQLNYSPWLLTLTLIGMGIIYLIPPLSFLLGIFTGNLVLIIIGLSTWLLMAIAYFPTIKSYQVSPFFAFNLPIIACLYTLMTFDSAWRHWRGQGGAWKGRVYPNR